VLRHIGGGNDDGEFDERCTALVEESCGMLKGLLKRFANTKAPVPLSERQVQNFVAGKAELVRELCGGC
jgi:hypothetical protein